MGTRRMKDQGKMNRWRFLRDMIKGADAIIEIVDSRDIGGTRLPLVEKWSGSKRLVLVANKADLSGIGSGIAEKPRRFYISAKHASENDRWDLIREIMARSDARPIKAILVGYPNVGKSSLVNMLARRKAAKVSAVAGTTKDIQWVKVSEDLVVSDYRGVYPESETKSTLVMKGAINVQGDEERYAYDFLKKVLTDPKMKRWLAKEYDVEVAGIVEPEDVLIAIAERRKWYLKGGEPNINEAARNLIRKIMEAPKIG